MNFVSSKARVRGRLEGENVILGPTQIGAGSILGRGVIVGYPVKKALKDFRFPTKGFSIEEYDSVSRGAKIGDNCVIRSGSVIYEKATLQNEVETGHNVLIREGSVIGEKSRVGTSTQLDGAVKIGKNVNIQSNVYLSHLTIVKDGVFIGPNVCVTNDLYPESQKLTGAVIERGAVIGANTTIVAKVKIGEEAVVGAGSVVTKDVPANTVVLGNPARFHTARKEYDKKKALWERT